VNCQIQGFETPFPSVLCKYFAWCVLLPDTPPGGDEREEREEKYASKPITSSTPPRAADDDSGPDEDLDANALNRGELRSLQASVIQGPGLYHMGKADLGGINGGGWSTACVDVL